MDQVIDGKLYCDGEPVGVRRQVVRHVMAEGYAPGGCVGDLAPVLARGAAEEMLKIEREFLLKEVEISFRQVYPTAA